MNTRNYQVTGYYQGAPDAPVRFSVQAMSERMVLDFVKGYIPTFVVSYLRPTLQQETTHYAFADVNPCIAARFHLGNRRRTGSAVMRPRRRQHTGVVRTSGSIR